jgi:hypothetical protein
MLVKQSNQYVQNHQTVNVRFAQIASGASSLLAVPAVLGIRAEHDQPYHVTYQLENRSKDAMAIRLKLAMPSDLAAGEGFLKTLPEVQPVSLGPGQKANIQFQFTLGNAAVNSRDTVTLGLITDALDGNTSAF